MRNVIPLSWQSLYLELQECRADEAVSAGQCRHPSADTVHSGRPTVLSLADTAPSGFEAHHRLRVYRETHAWLPGRR